MEKRRPPEKTVPIATPYIRLEDLLKLAGIAATGGHAKLMIQGGEVRVNGAVDCRRGRKLRPGDRVACAAARILVGTNGTGATDAT